MNKFKLLATTAFGTEGITKKEVERLGYKNISVENGRVYFETDQRGLIQSNLWLRTASKIYWVIGAFESHTFSELYDQVHALPWDEILNKNATMLVNAKSVKSELHSLSSIQSISKKAIVDKLQDQLACEVLPEDAEDYEILIDILKDQVTVRINTTGEGLFKRGYRLENNEAPLRETLAATLVDVTNWKAKIPLVDPMCGTGTILIEAAMYGRNMAPGVNRKFAFEDWPFIKDYVVAAERKKAKAEVVDREMVIKGFDKDPEVIEVARANAERAGVGDFITFECRDLKDFETDIEYGYLISNPPYGERLGNYEEAEEVNEILGGLFRNEVKTWSMYIFTAFNKFEDVFGKKATKNRKLYNGKLKCYFYQYYGPRPPKNRL
jgi:putative N6-adenine-specific DNA methylase